VAAPIGSFEHTRVNYTRERCHFRFSALVQGEKQVAKCANLINELQRPIGDRAAEPSKLARDRAKRALEAPAQRPIHAGVRRCLRVRPVYNLPYLVNAIDMTRSPMSSTSLAPQSIDANHRSRCPAYS